MNIRRFTIVCIGCLVFLGMLLLLYIPGRAQPVAITPYQPTSGWTIECVDCPKSFLYYSGRGLQIDTNGHSHIAYGGDHLYYAWYDGAEWQYETVDTAPDTGWSASLVLDGSNYPHIAYNDSMNDVLKYAYQDNTGWHIQTVDTQGYVSVNPSLALDTSGYPHISYYDFTNKDLKYTYFDGSAWHIETVDTGGDVGRYNSNALDSNNFPHISYYDVTNDSPKYAYWTGAAWDIQTLNSPHSGKYSSIAIDSMDHPHISFGYYEYPASSLIYANWTGSAWDIQELDPDNRAGFSNSIVLDSSDHPYIATQTDYGNVELAAWNGSAWEIQTVDGSGNAAYSISLGLADTDIPRIAYSYNDFTTPEYSMRQASWNGSAWDFETIDTASETRGPTSLSLDEQGNPHVAYQSGAFVDGIYTANLSYARWDGNAWEIQTVDGSGDVSELSMAIEADGTPHIAYLDDPSAEFRYAHWTGSSWDIQTVGPGYGDISIALDSSGFPHLAYFNNELYHVYWDGSAWISQVVDTVYMNNGPVTLVIDSQDHAHIGYYLNNYIKYAYWDGSGWNIQVVNNVDIYRVQNSLALDSLDNPHISYYDHSNADLMYATWSGETWDIQVVDSGGDIGLWNSIALDSMDLPHISYYDNTNSDLKYASWDGNSWLIQTVDSPGVVGRYTSLKLDGADNPHISYFNYTTRDIMLAHYSGEPVAPENVDLSGPMSGDVKSSLIFTATVSPISTTIPIQYVWEATGQSLITQTGGLVNITSFVWDAPGTQIITVTATNAYGVVSDTQLVSLAEVPISGLIAFNNSPTYLGQATTITATVSSGTNITYAWDFGDGTSGDGANVTHTYPDIGLYTATVTATNSVSSQTTSTLVTITDVPITGLSAVNNSPTILGEVTTLTATVTAGTNVIYTWDFGDGTSGNGATVTHTYPDIGLYTATVIATNSVGSQIASTLVTITDVPIADLTAINDSPTTLGEVTTLAATVAAGTNVIYTWDFGDGTSGDGATVTHTYPDIGLYTSTVTATNSVGSQTASTLVTITDAPITGLTAVNDSPTTLGEVTTFTATVAAGTNVIYTWDFGDGTTGSGAVETHTYTTAGDFIATVTASNGVSTTSTTTPVTILPAGPANRVFLPTVIKH